MAVMKNVIPGFGTVQEHQHITEGRTRGMKVPGLGEFWLKYRNSEMHAGAGMGAKNLVVLDMSRESSQTPEGNPKLKALENVGEIIRLESNDTKRALEKLRNEKKPVDVLIVSVTPFGVEPEFLMDAKNARPEVKIIAICQTNSGGEDKGTDYLRGAGADALVIAQEDKVHIRVGPGPEGVHALVAGALEKLLKNSPAGSGTEEKTTKDGVYMGRGPMRQKAIDDATRKAVSGAKERAEYHDHWHDGEF